MKSKRRLTMFEFFGVVLVVVIIAVAVVNIRSCSFTRTTTGPDSPSQTTVETTTTNQ